MNMIITCSRNNEFNAREEMKQVLDQFKNHSYNITITKLSGILLIKTSIDPKHVIELIKNKIILEPWSIRYCSRIIPIHNEVKTTVMEITNGVLKLLKLNKDDRYRITIEKRNSKISTKEIISKIAKNVPNKVSLTCFDYEIMIQIVGERTGITVEQPNSILSVLKLKRSESE